MPVSEEEANQAALRLLGERCYRQRRELARLNQTILELKRLLRKSEGRNALGLCARAPDAP